MLHRIINDAIRSTPSSFPVHAILPAGILLAGNLATSIASASPTVRGNEISWPADGWYQVQSAETYQSLCNGGTSCTVEPGRYTVINHTLDRRWENIAVPESAVSTDTSSPNTDTAAVLVGPSVNGNTLSWPDDGWYQVQRADTYETVCQAGTSCVVENGTYTVINHTTGQRWNDLSVGSAETLAKDNSAEFGDVTVTGNMISWPDNGWYEVQEANTYTTVCAGVRQCEVDTGVYTVINHTKNERTESVRVGPDPNPDIAAPAENNDELPFVIDGQVLTFTTESWFQVQIEEGLYISVCEGESSCYLDVDTDYTVIDHGTGKRYYGITVEETIVDPVMEPETPHTGVEQPDAKSPDIAPVLIEGECKNDLPTNYVRLDCLEETGQGFVLGSVIGQFDPRNVRVFHVGDVNGDGADDFAIQQRDLWDRFDDNEFATVGYIVFGGNPELSSISTLEEIPGRFGIEIVERTFDEFDASLFQPNIRPVGDVDGDGFADVMIARFRTASIVFGDQIKESARIVLDDLTPENSVTITDLGPELIDPYHYVDIYQLEDLNGDGKREFVFSARRDPEFHVRHHIIVFSGIHRGVGSVSIKELPPESHVEIYSSSNRDSFVVKTLNDVDGDGYSDLYLKTEASFNDRVFDFPTIIKGGPSLSGKLDLDNSDAVVSYSITGTDRFLREYFIADFDNDAAHDLFYLDSDIDSAQLYVRYDFFGEGNETEAVPLNIRLSGGTYLRNNLAADELDYADISLVTDLRELRETVYQRADGSLTYYAGQLVEYHINAEDVLALGESVDPEAVAHTVVVAPVAYPDYSWAVRSRAIPDVSGDGLSDLLVTIGNERDAYFRYYFVYGR